MPPNRDQTKINKEIRTILDFLLWKEYLSECTRAPLGEPEHPRGLTFEQWRKVHALPPTQSDFHGTSSGGA